MDAGECTVAKPTQSRHEAASSVVACAVEEMSKSARIRFFLAPAIALCACLGLCSCGTFSSYVSDHWPTWAGGMPADVPPRPGAPGYQEFISHQEAKDEAAAASAANAKPGAAPAVTTSTAPPAATPNVKTGNAQPAPPAMQPVNDQSAVQGGLY
jgi:hypothetical protein